MKIYSISGFCPDTENGEAHGSEFSRKLSPIGLIDGNGSIDLKDGINVTHLYSAMPFKIASLHLSAKEL